MLCCPIIINRQGTHRSVAEVQRLPPPRGVQPQHPRGAHTGPHETHPRAGVLHPPAFLLGHLGVGKDWRPEGEGPGGALGALQLDPLRQGVEGHWPLILRRCCQAMEGHLHDMHCTLMVSVVSSGAGDVVGRAETCVGAHWGQNTSTCLVCHQWLHSRPRSECHSVVCCREPLGARKVQCGGIVEVQQHPQGAPAGAGAADVDPQ